MFLKATTFLSCALMLSTQLSAQLGSSHLPAAWSHEKISRLLLNAADPSPVRHQHKTTAQHQRVVAQSNYHGTLLTGPQFTDSMVFKYSGTRGSSFDYWTMTYLEGGEFFNTGYVQFDTAEVFEATSPNPWITWYNVYSNSDDVIATIYQYDQRFFFYDAQGNVVRKEFVGYDQIAQQWDSTGRHYYFYDNNGWLVMDSAVSHPNAWQPYIKREFTRNSTGDIQTCTQYDWTPVGWEAAYRSLITYVAPGQPSLLETQMYDSGVWMPIGKDSNNYSGNKILSRFHYFSDSTGWNLYSDEYRYLNSSGLPDSIMWHQYDTAPSTVLTSMLYITYNSFDNPVELNSVQAWANHISRYKFYYELYQTSSVPDVLQAKELYVYPNPASAKLHIKLGQLTGNKLQVSVVNSLGQVVYMADMKNDSKLAVPVDHLRSGIYWVSVQDGKEVYRASFIKN